MNIFIWQIINIVIAQILNIIYFIMFIKSMKSVKEKKIKLYIMVIILYMILMFSIVKYQFPYCFVFAFIIWGLLKISYKNNTCVIDLFMLSVATLYVVIIEFSFYKINYLMPFNVVINSCILLVISKILLFFPYIFLYRRINKIYKEYKKMWNDNENSKIQSLTLRNISIISLNIIVFICNLLTIKK